jgi:hypothetical protein
MKTQDLFLLIFFFLCSSLIYSQGVTNDGAVIVIESGTVVTVANSGGYYNLTNTVSGDHGQIDLDGTLQISGDFENNVTDAGEHVFTNVGSDGYVVFRGTGNQTISNNLANAYIDFENVTVSNASNTVNVEAGSAISVNGNLTVSSGTFRLSSPTDGTGPTASLITNTSGSVSGTGALYVDRHFETNGRYSYFSSPVGNATDDMFTTGYNGVFNPNLYRYDESYDAPTDPTNTNYSNWSSTTYAFYDAWIQVANEFSSDPLSGNAAGYVTYNNIELDIEFGGSPSDLNNASDYTPSVTYTLNDNGGGAEDYYDGWNLIGNPYPCALDWEVINSQGAGSFNNIADCIYMYDTDAGNYIYYGSSPESGIGQTLPLDADGRYIPAMQAFMVKADGAPTFTIPDNARVHYQKDLYKEKEKITEFEYIRLKTEHNGFSDETLVRFFEDATPEVDAAYDAYKMFPWSTPVMIYSLTQNPETPVAINSLPVKDIGTSIPLGFLSEEPGIFTINTEEFNFDLSTDVKFIDMYEDKIYFVNEDFEYTFKYDGGEVRDRFYLFVAPFGSEIEEDEEFVDANTRVWANNNNIFISFTSLELLDSKVEVYDVLGRPVIQERLTGNYNVINVPGASGTYLVKVVTKNGFSRLDKVFIQK